MIFKKTAFDGVYLIELDQNIDERGFFARSFCKKEFQENDIDLDIAQSNISFNKKKGTLRGMHYQVSPHAEAKLVSCPRGAVYDVIIDLRLNSPTYCKWLAVELSAQNYRSLYIPKGFAHGFQALSDDTVVLYQMSESYHPESARGIRWDDPLFLIEWPSNNQVISVKDRAYPLFNKNIL
jgi:dTDP-4-dehydrorhamnose 3,5-epimerase